MTAFTSKATPESALWARARKKRQHKKQPRHLCKDMHVKHAQGYNSLY